MSHILKIDLFQAKMKDDLFESQCKKLEQFEKFLGDKNFFGGDAPKFPDFHLYEIITVHTLLFPEVQIHLYLSSSLTKY